MESSLNSIYHPPTETFKWYPSASSKNCRELIIFISRERVASCKHPAIKAENEAASGEKKMILWAGSSSEIYRGEKEI